MKKVVMLLMASAVFDLSGCVVQPVSNLPKPGVVVDANNHMAVAPVVKAAKALLDKQYAPASTKFHLAQPQDAFGVALVEELRQMGYGILETPLVPPKDKEGKPIDIEIPEDSKHLFYVWDVFGKDLYRLMLKVDEQRYAVVFAKDGEIYRLVSPWTLM